MMLRLLKRYNRPTLVFGNRIIVLTKSVSLGVGQPLDRREGLSSSWNLRTTTVSAQLQGRRAPCDR
jgi:hypothetical protein